MADDYVKQVWKDGKDGGTPIDAASLNHMEAGIAAAKGATGAVGATGPQGPKGDKGDKGDAGEAGAKGATGAAGAKGDKGDKGDTGAAGKDGAVSQADFDALTARVKAIEDAAAG